MAPVNHEIDILAVLCDGLLGLCDRRGRFEGSPEYHITSVADSAENTACMVRLLDDLVSVHAELVVVVGSAGLCGSKTVPDLKAFDSTDGTDSFGQISIQLFKNRITDAGRHTMNTAFDDTAAGVLFLHLCCDKCFSLCGSLHIRHIDRIIENIFCIEMCRIDGDRPDGL